MFEKNYEHCVLVSVFTKVIFSTADLLYKQSNCYVWRRRKEGGGGEQCKKKCTSTKSLAISSSKCINKQ